MKPDTYDLLTSLRDGGDLRVDQPICGAPLGLVMMGYATCDDGWLVMTPKGLDRLANLSTSGGDNRKPNKEISR